MYATNICTWESLKLSLLTRALDNETRYFLFLLIHSLYNEHHIYKEQTAPFILRWQWNQLPRWVPFGCQESHVTEKVIPSFNGQRPGTVSILQLEGQSHLTE